MRTQTSREPSNPVRPALSPAAVCLVVAGLLLCPAPFAGASPYDTAAAYWPMDEGASYVAYEVKAHNVDASLFYDAAWSLPGRVGAAAVTLDGTDDYVLAANYPRSTTAMSMSAWVLADAWKPSTAAVLCTDGMFQVRVDQSGTLLAAFWTGNWDTAVIASDPNAFTTGQWHHVAWTWSLGTQIARLYLDSEQVGATVLPQLSDPGFPLLGMGVKVRDNGLGGAYSLHWDGKIDDVAVWTRTLSGDEIRTLAMVVPEPASLGTMAVALLTLTNLGTRKRAAR